MSSKAGVPEHLLRLREHGIIDPAILAVVEAVPHEQFVPSTHIHRAWSNRPMPLACGQTMPPPIVSARLVAALNASKSHSVLEIGAGSGYQTALLAGLSKKVHAIDLYRKLTERARGVLKALGIENVTIEQADVTTGMRHAGKPLYDRIISDVAYEDLPRDLLDLLASGGSAVVPIGKKGGVQTVARLTKVGSRFEREDLFTGRFGMLEKGVAAAL